MKPRTMIRVIRKIAGPRAMIFNDRLRDGTRSVKIWGYAGGLRAVALALIDAGFAVKIRENYGGEARLHVWDFNGF